MPEGAAARGGTGAGGKTPDLDGKTSWLAAYVTLAVLSVSYGSPLVVVVGLKPMAASLDTTRSVLALAAALVWLGTGLGGILMGWVADRIGVRATVIFGGLMIASGLVVSASGPIWALYVGHGLMIGLLGNGAVYPPLVIYISRWFDRRRGMAIALISSGQYVAGVVWPSIFEHVMQAYGWRVTMVGFAATVALVIPAIAAFFLPRAVPLPPRPLPLAAGREAARERVLGLRPNRVQLVLCCAGFCCCVPMAVPSAHLVAFCSDRGIPGTQGAAMLSLMLGCAFFSRQGWGWLADRIGGLQTVLAGSACQALAITAFLLTQSETGLFVVAAAFGLGFSGIIPSYVVAIRQLFPSSEAAWRIPTLMFVSMSGMAFGSWFAGVLYDGFGFYAPAFATGVLFNLANIVLVGFLVTRARAGGRLMALPAE
jgi:MFS family permease